MAPMRLVLVNMPWGSLEVPSLALGILRRRAIDVIPEARVEVLHANLVYADWVGERTGLGVAEYDYIAQESYFVGVGDWIFSSALYDDPRWREREFEIHRGGVLSADGMRQAITLHRLAPRFVEELAERVVADRPDVVGFTSTFQQNVPALALARQIKRLAPDTVTVFGGANCDGQQGVALHRNFPFIDFVVRGEGERAFAALLTDIAATGHPEIAGLCWRRADGTPVANEMAAHPLPPQEIAAPDYTDYFAQLAASKTGSTLEPRLVVEGARGCWWGAKQHCTFCGLNGTSMQFRSKPAARFRDEVLDLVERHRVLDIFVVDNILDMAYLTSFLPMLAAADHDLRMQFEIKSNMRRHQLEVLGRGGASTVQPGIENFSSRVLQIMRKGVTGCQNVRVLRDAESLGLSVAWNYLYGFPGETAADYADILRQLPALHHLPPALSAGRVVVERFSPYFDDPALGFTDPTPDVQYGLTYDLPEEELAELAYLFRAAPCGIDRQMTDRVDEAVARWRREYPMSRFCFYEHDSGVTLVSRRVDVSWSVLRLTEAEEVAAFRALDQPRSSASLARAVGFGADDAEALLRRWRDLGIVFEESARFVRVAVPGDNQELFHLDRSG
jgi:ribosomal peptide maturation radical SAM protein 1